MPPSFRWSLLYHDIALPREVFSSRPDKPHDWELIAANRVTDERVTPLRLLALVTAYIFISLLLLSPLWHD